MPQVRVSFDRGTLRVDGDVEALSDVLRVLLDQWVSTLRAQFGAPIGAVGDGMKSVSRITVMTFESADEAHHFASGVRAEALEMCPAAARLGLTATPPAPGSLGAERLHELLLFTAAAEHLLDRRGSLAGAPPVSGPLRCRIRFACWLVSTVCQRAGSRRRGARRDAPL